MKTDQISTSGAIVVTSISAPNDCLQRLADGAQQHDYRFICVGDRKSPTDFELAGCEYYSLQQQLQLDLRFPGICPENHYARKNIAYLLALQQAPAFILETDDDNKPDEGFFLRPVETVTGRRATRRGWLNAYACFGQPSVWPRGYPLENIIADRKSAVSYQHDASAICPVQQGLANGDPDVDAVFRLTRDEITLFDQAQPLLLGAGQYCPFNSQNTSWFPRAFVLMYLPSTVSMRMTDIWRGFIAQVCLYACGYHWCYKEPNVYQHRNEHNLLNDFKLELDGYLQNQAIMWALESIRLDSAPAAMADNLLRCYEKLVDEKFIDRAELELLHAWLADFQAIGV